MKSIRHLKKYSDFATLALVLAGFLYVATPRLATVPVPHTDESYMLLTSYEMLYRGKLALPFRRLLGGNIENNWHSLTPVHYVIQSGFLKLFGWGLAQGRAFNLTMAILVLVMVYLIGRKLFDWRAGLIAIALLVCDVTFLERSRYLRNDFSAALFALLAFMLYESAERRNNTKLFIGSGLAAGAALMCHTSAAYIVLTIPVLMLLRRGWRIIKTSSLYQFALSVLVVSAYEIITAALDWNNVLLQNRGDRRHFKILDPGGWWKNIQDEPKRYEIWQSGDFMYADVPRLLTHLFYYLTVIALAYLAIRWIVRIKQGGVTNDARFRILVVTLMAVTFFAVVTSQKAVYYMAHLTPWFALAVGAMLIDGIDFVARMRNREWGSSRAPRYVTWAGGTALVLFAVLFGYQAVKQNKSYLRNVLDPNAATFDEFRTVMRSMVPDGVCPVVVREAAIWLVFPEHDLCFANIEKRMKDAVDIDGKEYALIVNPRRARSWLKHEIKNHHHLLGEMTDTPYGSFQVYYTGIDPRWLALEPMSYQFFGDRRGYTTTRAAIQTESPARQTER